LGHSVFTFYFWCIITAWKYVISHEYRNMVHDLLTCYRGLIRVARLQVQ